MLPFDLYLALSGGKYIKITHQHENGKDIIQKYSSQGVKEFFAPLDQYQIFMENLCEQLGKSPSSSHEIIESMSCTHEVIKEVFRNIGISETVLEVAGKVAQSSYDTIEKSADIFSFFKKYRTESNQEYLYAMMVGYINSCLLDHLDWSFPAIKQKTFLAIMLRDILD